MKFFMICCALTLSLSALACGGDKKESDKGKPKSDERIQLSL